MPRNGTRRAGLLHIPGAVLSNVKYVHETPPEAFDRTYSHPLNPGYRTKLRSGAAIARICSLFPESAYATDEAFLDVMCPLMYSGQSLRKDMLSLRHWLNLAWQVNFSQEVSSFTDWSSIGIALPNDRDALMLRGHVFIEEWHESSVPNPRVHYMLVEEL